MDVVEVIEALLVDPVDIGTVRATLPARNGVYAWWAQRGAIPGVPSQPHPREETLELFYVGIAPRDAKSSATLKSRISNNHIGGTRVHRLSASRLPPF